MEETGIGTTTLNTKSMKSARAAGAVKSSSGADGVLNWSGGEHVMTPTVDPDLIHPVTLDPASNQASGVTGVDDWPEDAQKAELHSKGINYRGRHKGPLTKAQTEHAEEVSERNETRKGRPLGEAIKRSVAITQHPQNDAEPNISTTDSGDYGRSMSQFHRK